MPPITRVIPAALTVLASPGQVGRRAADTQPSKAAATAKAMLQATWGPRRFVIKRAPADCHHQEQCQQPRQCSRQSGQRLWIDQRIPALGVEPDEIFQIAVEHMLDIEVNRAAA